MNLIRKKVIYYSSESCTAYVRNILKITFCVDNIKIKFVKGKKDVLFINWRLIYLTEIMQNIFDAKQVNDILENASLIEELQKLVKNKDEVPIALSSVLKYQSIGEKDIEIVNNKYVKLWNLFYGQEKFRLRAGTGVNSINYDETSTYLKLFEKQKAAVNCIENATVTLLGTIPYDVDTIADIGAGPGLVNQYIPLYYDVLAIDINQEILDQNSRKTCIGDILDIPLQKKAVDMTIACDILEHIEADKLDLAISELQRVSEKYIYIQVPHNEILRYGVAKCSNCNNMWHVNFHKNHFTLDKLRQYENNEWYIRQVNYTGYVQNELDNSEIYRRIEEKKLEIYRVENFDCPRCGAKSIPINLHTLEKMEKKDNKKQDNKRIIPKYSEIGVLFERSKEKNRKKQVVTEYNLNDNFIYSNMRIDFTKKYFSKSVYTGKEQIPTIFVGACQIEKMHEGISVKGEEGSWIGIALPYIIAGTKLEVRGISKCALVLTVVGIDKEEHEFQETREQIEKGDFEFVHKMSKKWKEHSTFLKLYFDNEFILTSVNVCRKDERKYYYLTSDDIQSNHYIYADEDIIYRYYIPKQGVAFEIKNNGIIEVG